ncbi:uncharacterized protein [Choristoneura fumiferana]|uniref:uncharacterized protein n=1 Tax=Choristoneura fumiferana TaxID=7141 RepID=UPI003D155ADD
MEPQHNDIKRPAPVPVTAVQSEADSICHSTTKRPRVWEPHSTGHSSNTPDHDATILDVLNADCWRLVLDYVPVGDVVRSERVSRAWQQVVRDYLAGNDQLNADCWRLVLDYVPVGDVVRSERVSRAWQQVVRDYLAGNDQLNADCWRLVLDYVPVGDVVRSERVSRAWQQVVRDYLAGNDQLNADCWRLVLDYVPVRDVVRSERVSRAWQQVVRDYLAGNDQLNADCWRLVLDYVPVRDVVRSERVSRAWQQVVRDYLAGNDQLNADCWRLVLDYVPVRDVVRSERVSRAWQQVVRDYLAGNDQLNADCWRLVLDYVPVRDVVRSERVSRAWQQVVRDYLAGNDQLNADCWRLVLDYVPVGDVVRSERVSRAWQQVVRDYLAGNDQLNADCWRLVLDYVPVRDVVRSERVSRAWQQVVRDYLAGNDQLNADCWRLVLDYVPVGDVVRSERVSRAWQQVVRDYLAGNDQLNADCWRLVLDYVPVRDVVRSERVSRAWQQVVRDYLAGNDQRNADCWRLVLDYVPVRDVVRSERVSRAWQQVVRDYLAGVHQYRIVHLYNRNNLQRSKSKSKWIPAVSIGKYRVIYIHLPKRRLFKKMIQKMGSYFVSLFAVRVDEEKIKLIAENCPNIKILKIRLFIAEPRSENVDLGILNKCKQLTQLSLYLVHQGGDSSLNEIVTSESLEELIILKHKRLTGSFLTNMRTSLKTLIFVDCDSLSIENILFVADRLKALTRLELIRNEMWNLQNAHLLLDGTPNLERLCLQNRNYLRSPWINLGHELPTAIGRLSRLRELRLWNNEFVTDEWLAIVARGCPALRSIEVWCPHVSAHGLLALCRTRPELKQLVVRHPTMKDREIEACVRSCEGLELLDVSFCDRLTRNLPERLAWPRARPLRLRIYNLLRRKSEVKYDGITMLWNKPRSTSDWPDCMFI